MSTIPEQLDQTLASAKWTESSRPLREICLTTRLPAFCKVAKGVYKDANKHPHDTVLLHSVQKSPHVIAEGFRMNGKPTKEKFSIPFTYGGWLEVMSEDLKHIKPITSVDELIKLAPKSFLVRSELKAVYSEPGCDQVSLNKVRKVCIGEKLNYCEQFQVDVKAGKKVVPRKFIRCKDSNKNNIFIDVDAKVQFNSISESDKVDAVHQLRDLLCKFRLPVTVHVIDENIPASVSRSFLPVFRLQGVYIDETVFTCPAKAGSAMVAMPTSAPLHFFEMAGGSKGAKLNEATRNLVKFCGSQIVKQDAFNIVPLETAPDQSWLAAGSSFLKGLQSKHKPGLDTISDHSVLSKVSKVKSPEEERLMLQEIEDIYRYVREGGEPPPSRLPPPSSATPVTKTPENFDTQSVKSADNDIPIYNDIESIKEKKARDSVLKTDSGSIYNDIASIKEKKARDSVLKVESGAVPSSGPVITSSATIVEEPPTKIPVKFEPNAAIYEDVKVEEKTVSANLLNLEKNITNGSLRNKMEPKNVEPVQIEISDKPKDEEIKDPPAGSLDWMKIFQAPEDIISIQKKDKVDENPVDMPNRNTLIENNDVSKIEHIKSEEIKSKLPRRPSIQQIPPPPPLPLSEAKTVVPKVDNNSPTDIAQKSKPKGPPPPPKKSTQIANNNSNAEKLDPPQKQPPQKPLNNSPKQFVMNDEIVGKQKALIVNQVEKPPLVPSNSKAMNGIDKAPAIKVPPAFVNSKSANLKENGPSTNTKDNAPPNLQKAKGINSFEKVAPVAQILKPANIVKVDSPKMAVKSNNFGENRMSEVPVDKNRETFEEKVGFNASNPQIQKEDKTREESQRSTKYIYTSSSYDVLNNDDYDDRIDVNNSEDRYKAEPIDTQAPKPTVSKEPISSAPPSFQNSKDQFSIIKVNGHLDPPPKPTPPKAVVEESDATSVQKSNNKSNISTDKKDSNRDSPVVSVSQRSPVATMDRKEQDRNYNANNYNQAPHANRPPHDGFQANGYPYMPPMGYPPYPYNTMPYYPPMMPPNYPPMMNPYPNGMGMGYPPVAPNFYNQFSPEDFARLLQMKQGAVASDAGVGRDHSDHSEPKAAARQNANPGAVSVIHIGKSMTSSVEQPVKDAPSKVGNSQVYVTQTSSSNSGGGGGGGSSSNSKSNQPVDAANPSNFSTKYNYSSK